MANDAKAARERRKLKKQGGANLPAVAVSDLEAWVAILREKGLLVTLEGDEPTLDQVRWATGEHIRDQCRAWRDAEFAKILAPRTGQLERNAQAAPPVNPDNKQVIFGKPQDWSLQSKGAAGPVKQYTPEEILEHIAREED